MAINIYSGGSGNAKQKTAQAVPSSPAERAKATTSAISGDAVASNSGSTAVKSGGILGKIGSVVNKVAGFAKYVPGVVGNVASVVEKLTSANDPEWWQHVPGDGLSCNAPLAPIKVGTYDVKASESTIKTCGLFNNKPAILEFICSGETLGGDTSSARSAMHVSDRMATQYLMPAVRKVANAITLQSAQDYASVFEAQATLYALWVELKRDDYFVKNGNSFLPSVNDSAFPLFQVENAAFLQSTITRLEEYLRSNVRLPHTLCEYLTWRFGTIFRTNNSAKAGFVFYSVLPNGLYAPINQITKFISDMQAFVASTTATQKAAADLMNAYIDHDQAVFHDDSYTMHYDAKEFALRTNLDLLRPLAQGAETPWAGITENAIIIDSNLDNSTLFMASTVSTTCDESMPLFPVQQARIWQYFTEDWKGDGVDIPPIVVYGATGGAGGVADKYAFLQTTEGSRWFHVNIFPYVLASRVGDPDILGSLFTAAAACKAVDFYNVGIFIYTGVGGSKISDKLIDITAISYDSANVPDLVITNEQVLAFANLVSEENKNATTYKQVEKRVAKDVANFVDNTEMATLAAK